MSRRDLQQTATGQIHVRKHPDDEAEAQAREKLRGAARETNATAQTKLAYVIHLLEQLLSRMSG